ncbi:MAG TPA: hypothetical protein VIN07_03720 [Flavipsychrobacter sp.]
MHYTATVQGNRRFEVFGETNELAGTMECNFWRPAKAVIAIGDTVYHIAPSGFWQTTMIVTRHNSPFAEIKFSMSKGLKINFSTAATTYFFKYKGFWHTRYAVWDEYGQETGIIEPHFNWKALKYSYDMEIHAHTLDKEAAQLLPLLMLYCLRYTRMLAAGAY